MDPLSIRFAIRCIQEQIEWDETRVKSVTACGEWPFFKWHVRFYVFMEKGKNMVTKQTKFYGNIDIFLAFILY